MDNASSPQLIPPTPTRGIAPLVNAETFRKQSVDFSNNGRPLNPPYTTFCSLSPGIGAAPQATASS
ncbi:unnamed protein product [Schistosoma mattheei]|uniref:Uncharacterized protein n=1 Tax=Schistosoma mattheei TaxID=31246 RepID=A0A3P7ZJZ0_9TREM|nr:unnamed protein product [Schistosoma mattheei]